VLITHNLRIGVLDIPPPILSRVYQTLSRGFVNLLNAVKIKDTNFPFPWAQMIMILLVVHSVFTPCVVTSFMTSYQWAIPVTFVPVFGMFALNQVAAQLEMPFGQDDNDLPLEHFQKEMNQSLLQLMHEMSDHLPSTKPSAKTHVDELRCFVDGGQNICCPVTMELSDSKVFETLALDTEEDEPEAAVLFPPETKLEEVQALPTPSEDMGEIKDDNPSRKLVEEKAADKLDDKLQFQATEMEAAAYALAAQHVADIARSTEALLTLGQTLPTALRQHSEDGELGVASLVSLERATTGCGSPARAAAETATRISGKSVSLHTLMCHVCHESRRDAPDAAGVWLRARATVGTPRQLNSFDKGGFDYLLQEHGTMTTDGKDDYRTKCAWDGEPSTWQDYTRRVRLAFERTSRRKRHLLAPEMVSQLTGRAWSITQDIDHARLVRREGVIYLLSFLREKLGRLPVPDIGVRLENLILKLRRSPGQSMATWASNLRQQYRLLQVALARVRSSDPDKPGADKSSPVASRSGPSSASSPHRRASGTMEEEPHAEAQPDAREQEETETIGPEDDEEEVIRDGSPSWRRRRRDRRDSDSDDSQKALADLHMWQEQEEHLPEVLPPEVLGWLLLRRANLSQQERLSVQAASNNSLRIDDVEKALRSMEDELVHADAHKQHLRRDRDSRRRSYWMEEDGQWSLLTAETAELDDIVEQGGALFVGGKLPAQVYTESAAAWYQGPPEDWSYSDEGAAWWSDPGWEERAWWQDPDGYADLTIEEQKEVDEAFAVAEQKARGFIQARQAIKARNLSRGFYTYNPGSKSGSFKGKSKGK
ncbi:unnamed protein product, partial [Symbiodinium sp. CCMP2456]